MFMTHDPIQHNQTRGLTTLCEIAQESFDDTSQTRRSTIRN